MRQRASTPAALRYLRYVRKTSTCWLYEGTIKDNGYGTIGAERTGKSIYVHRLAWELANGPIPDDLTIDHLCNVRNCVNPAHLETVTAEENRARGAQRRRTCANGHPKTEANSRWVDVEGRKRPTRVCRDCHRDYEKRRRNAAKAAGHPIRRTSLR